MTNKCLHCGCKAAYELRYSGHWVCSRHFIELFERRVKKTIRQNRLLSRGDRILVALSGGKGSITALSILDDIVKPIPATELFAVTVDEGRKGMSKMAAYCRNIGIKHRFIIVGGSRDGKTGKASDKGELKWRLIEACAREVGANKIATGHDLADEVRSAFINVMRGDLGSYAGLGSMVKEGNGITRIKILRECPDEEVKEYADLMGLPYLKKRAVSADDPCADAANGFIDSLEKGHPGSRYQMLRSADALKSALGKKVNNSRCK
ncbi:MAG: ATP-binding protein [Candidatus Altiarchaeota archaeon]